MKEDDRFVTNDVIITMMMTTMVMMTTMMMMTTMVMMIKKTFTLQGKQQWALRFLILPENEGNLNHCYHRTLDPMKITTITRKTSMNTFLITTILKIKITITFMITHLENNNSALLLWSVLLPSSSQPFVLSAPPELSQQAENEDNQWRWSTIFWSSTQGRW